MLIRCEKCSTLYELDEKLLPPQGAAVQCSKCQFVFKAYPPAEQPAGSAAQPAAPEPPLAAVTEPDEAPGEPLQAANEVPAVAEEPPPGTAPDDLVREGGAFAGRGRVGAGRAETAPPPASGDEPRFTADGRPIRKVPFPTSDAPPLGVRPTATRVPPPRSAGKPDAAVLMRWVIVAVVLVAIAIGAALAWRTYRTRSTVGSRARVGQSSAGGQDGTPAPQPRN